MFLQKHREWVEGLLETSELAEEVDIVVPGNLAQLQLEDSACLKHSVKVEENEGVCLCLVRLLSYKIGYDRVR